MKFFLFIFFLTIFVAELYATEKVDEKRELKSNMQVVYEEIPQNVDSFANMFKEGKFYGRLRFNSFGFKWKDELKLNSKTIRKNHAIGGIGGSVIYKSAYLNGFAFTAGLYASVADGTLENSKAYLYKSGKGIISRYNMLNDGQSYMLSLAQAYLEYRHEIVSIKAGRLIFESFLTASNDTKMIPNTFEGLTLKSNHLKDSVVKMAYLTGQKLRDHTVFHHIFARGELSDGVYGIYSENDDSGMHFGFTKRKLDEQGIKDRLIIIEGKNSSLENLTLRMNYTALPNIVSSAMIQADYKFDFGNFTFIPALRYMQQFDNGGGEIGGANLKTITEGYTNPDSLDSWLLAARVDLKRDAWRLRFGYTQIADKGDLIAPWRGFPTGGFSRAMGQYNWYANTKSYMLRADFDFDSAGLIPGTQVFMRYVVQDFDDNKIGVQADSNIVTLDVLKEFISYPGLYMKFRMAHVEGDNDIISFVNGVEKTKLDPSYNEARFEINYLF
jgi:hypothetical protein